MRLRNLSWPVNNALLNTSVLHDKTLVIGTRATNISRCSAYNLLHSSTKSLHQWCVGSDPGRASSIALHIFIAKARLVAGLPLKQFTNFAACLLHAFAHDQAAVKSNAAAIRHAVNVHTSLDHIESEAGAIRTGWGNRLAVLTLLQARLQYMRGLRDKVSHLFNGVDTTLRSAAMR